MRQLLASGSDARAFAGKIVCAIGSHTAAICKSYGIIPDTIPKQSTTPGVINHYETLLTENDSLIPTTAIAGNDLLNYQKQMQPLKK